MIIVGENGVAQFEEKKSVFIGNTFYIENEEQALEYIAQVRKSNWDARHHCYAYVLGESREVMRFSDDGEPSHTAGKPILDIIINFDITNILIVVTRYFGGTLLGTGGLVRAYSKTAKQAVLESELLEQQQGIQFKVLVDYGAVGRIQYLASEEKWEIEDAIYQEKVMFVININESKKEFLIQKITEATNGTVKIDSGTPIKILIPYTLKS